MHYVNKKGKLIWDDPLGVKGAKLGVKNALKKGAKINCGFLLL